MSTGDAAELRAELARRDLDWITPEWPAPAGVCALVTTRNGGTSAAPWASMNLGTRCGDAPEAVAANVRLLREVTGVEPRWLNQVHGTTIARVEEMGGIVEADAAVTSELLRAAVVRIADCLPVLFCNDAGTEVAAAHAGWRGLCAGVLEATVGALRSPPQDLHAWLGPAIGPTAFEVGSEVRAAFVTKAGAAAEAFVPFPGRDGKWLADLYALARQRLREAGVASIHGGGFCTVHDEERFFSYRRDGVTGRMAAMIWLA